MDLDLTSMIISDLVLDNHGDPQHLNNIFGEHLGSPIFRFGTITQWLFPLSVVSQILN